MDWQDRATESTRNWLTEACDVTVTTDGDSISVKGTDYAQVTRARAMLAEDRPNGLGKVIGGDGIYGFSARFDRDEDYWMSVASNMS